MTQTNAEDMIGTTAYDNDGDKIGKVGQVYLDDSTGQPAFLTINTGFFGSHETFVPIGSATYDESGIRLPFDKKMIKDAPNFDASSGHLEPADESALYSYYGLGGQHAGTQAGTVGSDTTVGHDTSGPVTDDAMTRSEEHLEVGTTTQESGRARLRKYVTTETETATVPVAHERAVVETEPVTAGTIDAAVDGPAISEEEHEVVLHEERPVTGTVVEPVERVRLSTETVVGEETVAGEVRKEHVEVDGDVEPGRP